MEIEELENIKKDFLREIENIKKPEQIKDFKADFLGKKSKIIEALRAIRDFSIEQKREWGFKINELRNYMVLEIEKLEKKFIDNRIEDELRKESLDITLPVRQDGDGLIHPIAKVQREFRDILFSMGFCDTNGSEIENDWNCFEGLNFPPNHPARQMQDTFYLKSAAEGNKILLRTQTTSLQMREMSKRRPPFKFFTTGKTFRSEMDATHTPMFHQIDVVYVDENKNMQDLKNCLITICKRFFNLKSVQLRFRPSFFPFTNPSVEIDIKYKRTGREIEIGEGDRWLEILGAGMVHPNVLKNVNLDPEKYQGFAFAFGIERMAMLKYGVGDIRNLYDGNAIFLRRYGFKVFD
jgi:phenylalanyl-tRNA synthetase alpha chain